MRTVLLIAAVLACILAAIGVGQSGLFPSWCCLRVRQFSRKGLI